MLPALGLCVNTAGDIEPLPLLCCSFPSFPHLHFYFEQLLVTQVFASLGIT